MMRFSSFVLKSFVGAIALGVCLAASAYTFTRPFSYFANNTDLKKVLVAFAQTQGLTTVPSSAIRDKISGRFSNIPARDFVKALEEAYGVGYYVLGKEIYFYPLKNQVKRLVSIREGSAESIILSLKASNIISNDLPVRVNSRGTLLTIVGPASYADQVRSAVKSYEAEEASKIVMRVFSLKHAWAEDIEVSSMDKTVKIPGIASILRAMVMGQSVAGQTVTQTSSSAPSATRLSSTGLPINKSKENQKQQAATPVAAGSVSIMADPRVNAVLVSDVAYRMPYYQRVIDDLDKPVELVEIHAAIVDVDTSANLDLGINYQGFKNESNGWQSGGAMGAANSSSPGITTITEKAGALLSTVYTHGQDFFFSRISAMESNDEARVLGRPSILTVDNVQATLENTTTYYVPVHGEQAVDLLKVESGTVLRVTPHIIHENGKTSIKLLVNVQDDQDNGNTGTYTTNQVIPVKQTKINTQAIVDVGQSLLIGGYYYEQKTTGGSGVPILKDIPLLGYLFRSTSNSSRMMERLILITPRIVTPSGDNVPAHVNTKGFRQAATRNNYDHKAVEQAQEP